MSELHQQLMNQAYDKWPEGATKKRFWLHLSFLEKVAVFTGNFNYQVENGGFMQWHDNGYSECAYDLCDFLEEINTETTLAVSDMITQFVREMCDRTFRDLDEDEFEDLSTFAGALDNRYYRLNDQFMSDVENFLQRKAA